MPTDKAESFLTVIHVWKCSHCGSEQEQRFPVQSGLQMIPPTSITPPEGWRVRDGEAYCNRHDVRIWPRIRDRITEGGGDEAA